MALTYYNGWESGTLGDDQSSGATVVTSPVFAGADAMRLSFTAAVAYWLKNATSAHAVVVMRCMVRFTALPNADVQILGCHNGSNEIGVFFEAATGKFRTGIGGSYGAAGGPVLATGTWYRADAKFDASANPWTSDGMVDGTPLTQMSVAVAASVFPDYRLGDPSRTPTATVVFDELFVADAASDYPFGLTEPGDDPPIGIGGRGAGW